MAAGELSPADHRADFLGKLQKAKCVCDRRARLDDALRDLLLCQTVVAHQLARSLRLPRIGLRSCRCKFLDERKLHDLALARFNDHRRDLVEAGLPGRAPSPLARDNLICAVFFTRAHRNRCDDAVQADAFRQLVKRLLREYLPRLIGVWFDAADRDFADAVRRGFGVQVSDRVIPEQVGQTAAQSQTFSCLMPSALPLSVLRENFIRERQICFRTAAHTVVCGDRLAMARRLAQADVARNRPMRTPRPGSAF